MATIEASCAVSVPEDPEGAYNHERSARSSARANRATSSGSSDRLWISVRVCSTESCTRAAMAARSSARTAAYRCASRSLIHVEIHGSAMITTPARTAPTAASDQPVLTRSTRGPITATRPIMTSARPTRTRTHPCRSARPEGSSTPAPTRIPAVPPRTSSLWRHRTTAPAPTMSTGPHNETRIGSPRAASASRIPNPRARIPSTPVRSQPPAARDRTSVELPRSGSRGSRSHMRA